MGEKFGGRGKDVGVQVIQLAFNLKLFPVASCYGWQRLTWIET